MTTTAQLDTVTETSYSHVVLITGARTWDNEPAMRAAFNKLWATWGADTITRPLLISGHAARGADALAERVWRAAGFDVLEVPADWNTHGKAAGFTRNKTMVDLAVQYQAAGSTVACVAFLDYCRGTGGAPCRQQIKHQLLPLHPGHFSHGTIHCRALARVAHLDTHDVFLP